MYVQPRGPQGFGKVPFVENGLANQESIGDNHTVSYLFVSYRRMDDYRLLKGEVKFEKKENTITFSFSRGPQSTVPPFWISVISTRRKWGVSIRAIAVNSYIEWSRSTF